MFGVGVGDGEQDCAIEMTGETNRPIINVKIFKFIWILFVSFTETKFNFLTYQEIFKLFLKNLHGFGATTK
jgi:hypothetical protein